jgi:hypothetical protein
MRWMFAFTQSPDGKLWNKWQYENDPTNPDAQRGQPGDPQSIFYQNPQGAFSNIDNRELLQAMATLTDSGSGNGSGLNPLALKALTDKTDPASGDTGPTSFPGGDTADPSGLPSGWDMARVTKLATSLGIPVATLLLKLRSLNAANGPGGSNGVPGPFGAQINDTLGLMNDRLRSTIPVHDAAMQLALKMGAPSNPDPALLSAASSAVRSPTPTMSPSPEVAAAAAALAKRFGG